MAITTLQVTQTGSAVQIASAHTYARWIQFQNNASHVMRNGDVNVTTSRGVSIAASGGFFAPPPAESGQHHDLSQWYTIGTNADVLDIVYDSMN